MILIKILSVLLPLSFAKPPAEFVDLSEVDSTIAVEMRYFSDWNFMGRVAEGYKANKCFVTKKTAEALAWAQKELLQQNLSLLVLDCYRPQRAVEDFIRWAKDSDDLKMEKVFYPQEPKRSLHKRGYLATKSGHSRGSTLDLTLVRLPLEKNSQVLTFKEDIEDCRKTEKIESSRQLDMGTTYDCFSDLSKTASRGVSKQAQSNRLILKKAMQNAGFYNYPREWWHYTLRSEPFRDRYFDFIVE